MSESQKKRSKLSHSSELKPSGRKDEASHSSDTRNEGPEKENSMKQSAVIRQKDNEFHSSRSFTSALNVLMGLAAMVAVSCTHSLYMYQIHENNLWFSNIEEVEREISFRTESGLYYSYFKHIVQAPTISEGIEDLVRDRKTEHPQVINILERMNVYQEVILACIYRIFGIQLRPIFFYIYFIFGMHGFLVSSLYLMAWVLSGSWLSGLMAAAFYIFNWPDTTRVQYAIPLRESFSLPFLWMQAAALSVYFRSNAAGLSKFLSISAVLASTFFFCLFWQFSQFILMLQAFALFGVWVLGLVPSSKVMCVMLCQLLSLLAVSLLQFGNKMILGSLAVSFILVSFVIIPVLGKEPKSKSVLLHVARVKGISLLTLVLMLVLSTVVKRVLEVDSDEHIFKFLQNKFGVGDIRDFDSRMYLCLGIFGFLTWDTFERLTEKFVLPFYALAQLGLLLCLIYTVIRKWRSDKRITSAKDTKDKIPDSIGCLSQRPELAFHTVQAVFFGALAITTLRMKYLWTPYICVLAAVGMLDDILWRKALAVVNIKSNFWVVMIKSGVAVLFLAVMVQRLLPPVLEELKNETEFWDPDTVELMQWIIKNTPATTSFTGSMQLLAGVKLCTGRPITNHPHYEDKYLRQKTKELYQIYGRRKPAEVHAILKKYDSNYIILEDSICRAPSREGCRTPDLVDIDNGEMPDEPIDIQGLAKPRIPRFCEEVRNQRPSYAKYFKTVFVNNTFRIYMVT